MYNLVGDKVIKLHKKPKAMYRVDFVDPIKLTRSMHDLYNGDLYVSCHERPNCPIPTPMRSTPCNNN